MLSALQQVRLRKINTELQKYGILAITESLTKEQLDELQAEVTLTKKTVMESTKFNSYHTNPDYACAILVQEAIEILINPKDDSPIIKYVAETSNAHIREMESLYESYVTKNGENEKSKALKAKIVQAQTAFYESNSIDVMKTILKESAGKAQTIMSAKGLQDDMIDFQAKVGDLQNKYVDSFIAMVNDEYGADVALDIQNKLMGSLDELMAMVRKTKNDMLSIVNILSGNESSNPDSIAPDNTVSDETMDSELEQELDLEEPSSDMEDESLDDILDDDSLDSEFSRKE